MSVGVHNLSRRTKTLRPAALTEGSANHGESVGTEKFIDFKPIIFNKLTESGLANGDVDKLDKIAHRKKYNNYSITGIKELPLSGGITEDEKDEDTEESVKVNGDTSDVDTNSNASLCKQLGTKERELQVALQKQERYQSNVQDVTVRMERIQHRLSALGASPFKNLDQQISEQKVSKSNQ